MSDQTLFAEDSLVSRPVQQEDVWEWTMPDGFGPSSPDAFASLDQSGCWQKMSQGYSLLTLEGRSVPYSETWPNSGSMCSGAAFQRPPWVRRISVGGSSLWPTPAAQEPGWKHIEVVDRKGNPPSHPHQRFYHKETGRLVQKGLTQIVQMWPTPRANKVGGYSSEGYSPTLEQKVRQEVWPTPTVQDAHNDGGPSQAKRNTVPLNAAVKWRTRQAGDGNGGGQDAAKRQAGGHSVYLRDQMKTAEGSGQLNPTWVELLMGFPPGWTDLSD